MAAAMLMASEIVSSKHKADATVQDVRQLAFRIARELSVQRRLLNEGMDVYQPVCDDVAVSQILADISLLFADNALARTRSLILPEAVPDLSLKTDPFLVSRVVGNMITNALEATAEGNEVRVSVAQGEGTITFAVWNKEAIAEEMVTRIFQRNYSTKEEPGRGLGTYSMRLFGEEMLGGAVNFTTSREEGTTFRFSLPC
jgi:signal transduction histidine kinase